jgi:hypothetical protein
VVVVGCVVRPDIDRRGDTNCGASFSKCGRYRYLLWRYWHSPLLTGPPVTTCTWVMLNPSTADESVLDQTLRKCMGYSKAWGYDGMLIANLYALRSTDPKGLWKVEDPVGPINDEALKYAAARHNRLVCGWGANAKPKRVYEVVELLQNPMCLGVTKTGAPRHPLYLRKDAALDYWSAP